MITQQTYALLALQVYKSSIENTFDLPSQWVQIPQPTGTDGFAYAVYQNTSTNEIVISFRGTDNDVGDWAANLGVTFSQEAQAAPVYARVLRDYGSDPLGSNITFTGHSLGGGIAASMAVWFNRPATVFDPAPSESAATNIAIVERVGIDLGSNQPAAFAAYRANIATQFAARESNVTSYFAPGSIVYAGNTLSNTITGAGQGNAVDFGIANMGSLASMIDMHSQALLTAGLLSDNFRAATVAVQNALPLLMSNTLYAYKTTSADRNFLIDLIRSEQTTPANGKLTHFSNDMFKLGASLEGLNQAAQNAIIAQGIEWYYWQSNDYAGQEFFTQSGNLLQYTTAQGAGLDGALNKANLYTSSWLATLNSAYGLAYMPIIKTDYEQWNVNGGVNAVTATAKNIDKTQIYIGQAGADTFTGGNKDDVFFAGGGADTLEGGLGVFNCKNNRKYYKKHSTLVNKYAGYRHKFHSKQLNIFQTANSMKEVSL